MINSDNIYDSTPAEFSKYPAELTSKKIWLIHKDKVPQINGHNGAWNNPDNWFDFESAQTI